ncbi:MAG: hypothetical protein EKK63_12715 [Acinetobacter sp.]|uniref:hypothetical protein n=1 Tax=Acinetobacter sp. TaxID=472 RepID=UPI000FBAE665|nr:hypothetical protein [Acinetobacter sp.]RUP38236.1 MAG: hypothetical protein EKK63_12715 [Acinetobacter sp.]
MEVVNLDWKLIFVTVFGTGDVSLLVGGMILALLGAILSILIRAIRGAKTNPNSPDYVSFRYLIKDKWPHFLLGLLCTFVAMRFSVELTGVQATAWLSFIYGFLNYRIGNLIASAADAVFNKAKLLSGDKTTEE